MKEIWKDVVKYEKSYQVSNLGNVRSVDRVVVQYNGAKKRAIPTTYKGQPLKLTYRTNGYTYVVLCENNKPKKFNVHRLVAQAFISNPNNLPQVNHKDSVRDNNSVSNLEWVNNSSNQKHAFLNGKRILKGEEVGNSKLTAEQVLWIREKRAKDNTSYEKIAKEVGVARETVRKIVLGVYWKHI